MTADEIRARCETAGLKVEGYSEDFLGDGHETEYVSIEVPAGRQVRKLICSDLHRLGGVRFEEHRFIHGFDAIWSPVHKSVECLLAYAGTSSSIVLYNFAKLLGKEADGIFRKDRPQDIRWPVPHPPGITAASIGDASPEFRVLFDFLGDHWGVASDAVTLQFTSDFSQHDRARDLLVRYANSILFQADMRADLPVHLVSASASRATGLVVQNTFRGTTLTKPNFQYDPEAMALYWYARTAERMPLLRFLAYYQVLEFYFPVYSQRVAKEAVRNIIKDPTFDVTRDVDVMRLLRFTIGNRSLGEERAQLRATVEGCLQPGALKQFITENAEIRDFFQSKPAKTLARTMIKPDKDDAELVVDMVNRIYELRCRVVHTKASEAEQELLLPFSEDTTYLDADTRVLEFLARSAIIAGGRPFSL